MPDPVLRFQYPGIEGDDGREDNGKKHFYLFKTDRAVSEIQIFDPGAHVQLHAHPVEDGVWIVLSGKFTFYGEGDTVYGELEQYQGLLLPAGTKYWFENTSDHPAEIMRVDYHVAPEIGATAEPTRVMDSYGPTRWAPFADAEHQNRRSGLSPAR